MEEIKSLSLIVLAVDKKNYLKYKILLRSLKHSLIGLGFVCYMLIKDGF